MNRQYEQRDVCMYNICINNQLVREFTTKMFSQNNDFHDHRIYEYVRNIFVKKNSFQSAP